MSLLFSSYSFATYIGNAQPAPLPSENMQEYYGATRVVRPGGNHNVMLPPIDHIRPSSGFQGMLWKDGDVDPRHQFDPSRAWA
jgi:hypothetical protein